MLQQAVQVHTAEVARQRRYVRECARVLKELLVVVDARLVGLARHGFELAGEVTLDLIVSHLAERDRVGGLVEGRWVVVLEVLRESRGRDVAQLVRPTRRRCGATVEARETAVAVGVLHAPRPRDLCAHHRQ